MNQAEFDQFADEYYAMHTDSIAASGVVEPRSENIAIGAALDGLVLEVYVPSDKVGTHVTAGQPLFRVDDRHLKAQLHVAQTQLALAEFPMQPCVGDPDIAAGHVGSDPQRVGGLLGCHSAEVAHLDQLNLARVCGG